MDLKSWSAGWEVGWWGCDASQRRTRRWWDSAVRRGSSDPTEASTTSDFSAARSSSESPSPWRGFSCPSELSTAQSSGKIRAGFASPSGFSTSDFSFHLGIPPDSSTARATDNSGFVGPMGCGLAASADCDVPRDSATDSCCSYGDGTLAWCPDATADFSATDSTAMDFCCSRKSNSRDFAAQVNCASTSGRCWDSTGRRWRDCGAPMGSDACGSFGIWLCGFWGGRCGRSWGRSTDVICCVAARSRPRRCFHSSSPKCLTRKDRRSSARTSSVLSHGDHVARGWSWATILRDQQRRDQPGKPARSWWLRREPSRADEPLASERWRGFYGTECTRESSRLPPWVASKSGMTGENVENEKILNEKKLKILNKKK